MKEYWDSECVDNFEKYWIKELTESEKKTLIELRNKIFNTETNEEEIPKLYREELKSFIEPSLDNIQTRK